MKKRKLTPEEEERLHKARSVKIKDLIYGKMRRESASEWSSPCPRKGCPGQKDAFHVHTKENFFLCHSCHPKPGDVIEFVRWRDGLSFPDAITMLAGGSASRSSIPEQVARTVIQDDEWHLNAKSICDRAVATLHGADRRGLEYLYARGFDDVTIRLYRFGYAPKVYLPNTKKGDTWCYPPQPAIVIRWIDAIGITRAVRHRFLETHTYTDADGMERTCKMKALAGSSFSGQVFGRLPSDKDATTLIVCEGEFNAASIRQQCDAGVAVWSVGSESSSLPAINIHQFEKRYVWMDKESFAKLNAANLKAEWIVSPEGDANDCLRKGILPDLHGMRSARTALVAYANQLIVLLAQQGNEQAINFDIARHDTMDDPMLERWITRLELLVQ